MKADTTKHQTKYIYFIWDNLNNKYWDMNFLSEDDAKDYKDSLVECFGKNLNRFNIVKFLAKPILPEPDPSVIEIPYEDWFDNDKIFHYMENYDIIHVMKNGECKISASSGGFRNCSCVELELMVKNESDI